MKLPATDDDSLRTIKRWMGAFVAGLSGSLRVLTRSWIISESAFFGNFPALMRATSQPPPASDKCYPVHNGTKPRARCDGERLRGVFCTAQNSRGFRAVKIEGLRNPSKERSASLTLKLEVLRKFPRGRALRTLIYLQQRKIVFFYINFTSISLHCKRDDTYVLTEFIFVYLKIEQYLYCKLVYTYYSYMLNLNLIAN